MQLLHEKLISAIRPKTRSSVRSRRSSNTILCGHCKRLFDIRDGFYSRGISYGMCPECFVKDSYSMVLEQADISIEELV
jgi:hypothetical protein